MKRLSKEVEKVVQRASSKVNLDYIGAGFHVCRFCSTSIRNERGLPLGNFGQLFIKLEDGSNLSVNGCTDCLRNIDVKDPQTWRDIVASTVYGLAKEGRSQALVDKLPKIMARLEGKPKKSQMLNLKDLTRGQ